MEIEVIAAMLAIVVICATLSYFRPKKAVGRRIGICLYPGSRNPFRLRANGVVVPSTPGTQPDAILVRIGKVKERGPKCPYKEGDLIPFYPENLRRRV